MKEGGRALAAGVDVRFPSGDEENLLGSGASGLRPFVAFSASFQAIAPHVNVAYQWNGRACWPETWRSAGKPICPTSSSTRWARTSR